MQFWSTGSLCFSVLYRHFQGIVTFLHPEHQCAESTSLAGETTKCGSVPGCGSSSSSGSIAPAPFFVLRSAVAPRDGPL